MVDRIPLLNGSSDSTSKFRRQPVKPTLASDEAKDVYNNYIMFSILFSTNHACVITCLAYASAELGNYLGALSSGTLYLTYALVALCFSKLVLALMGSKATMIIASMGYSIYVAGFFFALVSPKELALHISIWTSLVGGACGGLLWGAQSYYYWKCAKRYSLVGNISVSVAQEYLSSAFTFIFIITEILFKCIASIHMVYYMYVGETQDILFALYAMAAQITCFSMMYISNIEQESSGKTSWGAGDVSVNMDLINIIWGGKLLCEDRFMMSMVPYQMVFGFSSSYIPFYVFGTIVNNSSTFGGKFIGLCSALVVLVGSVVSLPVHMLGFVSHTSQSTILVVAGIGLALSGLLLIKFSDEQMGTAEYLLPYLLLYGVSRGLWEDMNKKVLSEHLESTTDPASASGGFAMVTFISGISAAAGYFSFAFVPPHKVESFIFWSALVSVCVFLGYRVMSGYCKNLSVYNSKMKTGKKKAKTNGSSSNDKSKSKKNSLRPAVNDYEDGNEFTVP